MKFSKITTSLALCALMILVAGPSATVYAAPDDPTGSGHLTTTKPSSAPAKPTSTAGTPASSAAPPPPHVTSAVAPPPPKSSAAPATSAFVPPAIIPSATATGSIPAPQGGNLSICTSTDVCLGGLCAVQSANTTTMTCVAMPATICESDPVMNCTSNAGCDNTLYTYCGGYVNGVGRCAGLGAFGSCNPNASKSNLGGVIKIAGIAVGSVAALAVVFAMVRWQRRRQRAKMPADMFGEVDYGMTDRHSGAPSAAKAAPLSEPYPFSSRPHAHGSDRPAKGMGGGGGGGGYDDQYYEEPIAYNGHAKDQYHGHDNYGYDQHSGHGGHGDGGFYDNAQYDDYNQHPQSHHLSPVAAPERAVSPHHYNNYAAEPTELDFGGHGGHGGHGGGGYGGRY